ncbi:beta-ketoacyl synthase N-terminal-like domain-containing protein [Chitinophaga nivalis]|uniref:Ketosynthase family 3 (KS3) domain-containing protein n=1 Tax=Chitinophaga nivalis TaxID=2991709 RepID=A0ABT3IKA5_9BACT|nr:beta-ketoacyl synthase N-terminal-like domain-containing protein [Chitinophaga nivalis]MCW3465907.1 hypothetical protein [Chitinophaga nivalis]MCW3484402.1 hypothetical protein [Chitinophaga nivalis]
MTPSTNVAKVTGMGVVTPTGTGVPAWTAALKTAATHYSVKAFHQGERVFSFPVAAVNDVDLLSLTAGLQVKEALLEKIRRLRHISRSTSYGIYCALEAWTDAGFNDADTDLTRVAIISGGTNIQQAALQAEQEKYREKLQFMNPNYGLNFFDTDLVGALSGLLGIRGEGHTIGAASASGNMAVIQGCRLLATGAYDVVVVVAPLMDLSVYEYQGFTALGAMAPWTEGATAADICRPFDAAHRGFVYGQSAGCIILESAAHAAGRGKTGYGDITGYGISLDANRSPHPSAEGETTAMLKALTAAGINAAQLGYVNTHGSSSALGDATEVAALLAAGLSGVKANSTKSLIGHGLSAAGLVECIATLIQINHGFVHANHNLENPISSDIDWIQQQAREAVIDYALTNSFGFGGINTAIILRKN